MTKLNKWLNTNIFMINDYPVQNKHIISAIIVLPILWAVVVGVFVI